MKVNEKVNEKKRAEDPQFVTDITNIFYLQIAKNSSILPRNGFYESH